MERLQCFLALILLSAHSTRSWDIALTAGDQIELYSNKTNTINHTARFRDLTALAYDAVYNMLLFADKQNDNASIFSYNLATKKYLPLVRKRPYENIQGIAFDPFQSRIFWTDSSERGIFTKSLNLGSNKNDYGDLLIKMTDGEIPRAVAIDVCRGFIYWTNTNVTRASIERARLDGSERQVIVNTSIYMPVGLALDQRTQTLYWADDREGIHYSIETSDLEGKNRKTILTGTYHQPNSLTVSKDKIYWIDWDFKSVWKLSKDSNRDEEPEQIINFHDNKLPFGIVSNYNIDDQTEGVEECAKLRELSKNKTEINESFTVPKDMGMFCIHGVKLADKLACKCSPGYEGERCEISVCHNYCLNGDCEVVDGVATCRCKENFSGKRCEVDVCNRYCLHDGKCQIDKSLKPVCKCSEDFQGQRCETSRPTQTRSNRLNPKNANAADEEQSNNIVASTRNNTESLILPNEDAVIDCRGDWDPVRDPILMVLGVLTGLLCLACAILITQILHLKRRPRIKKRIIVKQNTPLTARPDQCEITIENCCNMNICETPCFEPRSTIRPSLLDSKPGKEDRLNLIGNMDYPEDDHMLP